jgi:hypothetical protein
MEAQCSVLGHWCAGNQYCGHSAHKDNWHIPYELILVKEAVNFHVLADQYNAFPSTLLAINAGFEGKGGPTEHGLCASPTADAPFSRVPPPTSDGSEEEQPAGAARRRASSRGAGARVRRPAAKKRNVRTKRVHNTVVCEGPAFEVLKGLTEWQAGHDQKCVCARCLIPADIAVRVIPRAVVKFWAGTRHLGHSTASAPLPSCSMCLYKVH